MSYVIYNELTKRRFTNHTGGSWISSLDAERAKMRHNLADGWKVALYNDWCADDPVVEVVSVKGATVRIHESGRHQAVQD